MQEQKQPNIHHVISYVKKRYQGDDKTRKHTTKHAADQKRIKKTPKGIQNNTKQTKYMKGHRITTKRYEYGDNTHTVQRLQAYHRS